MVMTNEQIYLNQKWEWQQNGSLDDTYLPLNRLTITTISFWTE